jgi:outer membrane protein assembly factor BamA
LISDTGTPVYAAFQEDLQLNINDSLKNITINNIKIIGNNRTKELIIIRELTFAEGQNYTASDLNSRIETSKLNLLKLPLFNYVTIQNVSLTEGVSEIYVIVEERWYIWPEISIINNERNFNTWWQTKDFSKLDYRFSVKRYNAFGLNHNFKVGVSLGFTREFWLYYNNIFLDKKQHHFLGVYASVFYQKQAFFITKKNRRETFVSFDKNALEGKEFEIYYTYRPGFNNKHRFSIAYRQHIADDSLVGLNKDYFGLGQTKLSNMEFRYRYTLDKRDYRGYPTKGIWFKTEAELVTGLPGTEKLNIFSIKALYKKYYQLSGRFYGANSLSIKKSFDKHEVYYLKKGLGYRDYIRGYEYYVIDGQDFLLSKNNLKFNILPTTIINLNFIPIKKFNKVHLTIFLNAYFDIAYVSDKYQNIEYMNTFSNQWQYSGGLGIDLATYYDKVFRFEYSIIRTGERGFFIHFSAPI